MDTCLGVPSDQEGRRGQGGVLSERTSTVDGEEAPLHSSSVLPRLRAATTSLPSRPASCLLELWGEAIPSGDAKLGSLWARSCPVHLLARPFLLASALVPPSACPFSSCPLIPEQPPAASPGCKQHLPQTQSLSRQDTRRPPAQGLSPSRELSGPESGSAEVPGPATPTLSREAQPQSPPALPGGTI